EFQSAAYVVRFVIDSRNHQLAGDATGEGEDAELDADNSVVRRELDPHRARGPVLRDGARGRVEMHEVAVDTHSHGEESQSEVTSLVVQRSPVGGCIHQLGLGQNVVDLFDVSEYLRVALDLVGG